MVKSMILFKNILARILKNNLDFFFKIIFQDYFAKILKNNSSVGWYSISRRGHSVTRRVGYSWAASGVTIIKYLRVWDEGTRDNNKMLNKSSEKENREQGKEQEQGESTGRKVAKAKNRNLFTPAQRLLAGG